MQVMQDTNWNSIYKVLQKPMLREIGFANIKFLVGYHHNSATVI